MNQTYMVLESVTSNTSKVIHVVNLEDFPEIRVGRGQDCDVRVTDISVSRLHSIIKQSPQGYFFLDDNHSKFGTLALV
jgi:pSer/pThr/pTyr-binding forkhead associated (FHA) protein